ncbi:MAG: HPF/RaiA family ribosome-associated protein [Acidobacteriota bacterium]
MLREMVYRGLDPTPRVEDALRRATRRLDRKISRFDTESSLLRTVLESHRNRPRFNISAHLTIRGATLHAREERSDPVTAIKRAFSDLVHQVERHVSHTRREHLRDKAYRPVQMLADQLARQAAREVQTLKPLNTDQLARLQRFIRRETLYRRLEGRFPYGIAPDAIVDETVVLALEEADEKPEKLSYEAWLFKLARRILDRRGLPASNGKELRVEGEAYKAGLLEPPTEEDWLTFYQPDENPSVGDLTVDPAVHSPEDLLARRELQAHVHRFLSQLPESWRHAFTLYTIEGFDVGAVASSLDSDSDRVRRQVSLATEFLREKLKETGYQLPPRTAH